VVEPGSKGLPYSRRSTPAHGTRGSKP